MGKFNEILKADVTPRTVPGQTAPKTGTAFGKLLKQDEPVNHISLPNKK
jgi:hypothetical protein